MQELRILELFSGIGGMHYAFKHSDLPGEIIAAVDINPIANVVYKHNYPKIKVLNNNIQKLTPEFIKKLNVNTILMSPPCQPFTRVGNQKDVEDSRTDALKHVCDILPELETVDKVLMENVKGFEKSKAKDLYIETLKKSGFHIQEFILSPTQFGIPNTRHRYYCLAKKRDNFKFDTFEGILERMPKDFRGNSEIFLVKEILESNDMVEYLLPDKLLKKRVWLLDIVYPDSINTICFTKAYTHYSEGTGSVLTSSSKEDVENIFDRVKLMDSDSTECLDLLKSLKLRYFTPKEVARLMSFPDSFAFPEETTKRQKYRLLGNSINVVVVGELIKLLCA